MSDSKQLPDYLTLLIALRYVDNGQTVVKKTGQKPYVVSREIVIYGKTPEEKQTIKAGTGTVFLSGGDGSTFSAESEDLLVHWEITRAELTDILCAQADEYD